MVLLPNKSWSFSVERSHKPLYFFKNVDLTLNGFQFTEADEFQVFHNFPKAQTTFRCKSNKIFMNDFYIVILGMQGSVANIIFLKNTKFYNSENEIPRLYEKPILMKNKQFGLKYDRTFYIYMKLLETQRVKLNLKSPIIKILFNGDQIIMQLEKHIFIYTPLATCTLDIVAIDIAVDTYLYILKEKEVLVYSDKLEKTIPINEVCQFVVPCLSHIFLIRGPFIYKVTDKCEILYDTIQFIIDVAYDQHYLYVSTRKCLLKLGLYFKYYESISISIHNPRLRLMDNYVVVYNSTNGIAYFDKNNLQRFHMGCLMVDLAGLATYKNAVAYLTTSDVHLYHYKEVDGNLYPENVETYDSPFNKNSIIINDGEGLTNLLKLTTPAPHRYYGLTFKNKRNGIFNKLMGYIKKEKKTSMENTSEIFDESEKEEISNIISDTSTKYSSNTEEDSLVKNQKNITPSQMTKLIKTPQESNLHETCKMDLGCHSFPDFTFQTIVTDPLSSGKNNFKIVREKRKVGKQRERVVKEVIIKKKKKKLKEVVRKFKKSKKVDLSVSDKEVVDKLKKITRFLSGKNMEEQDEESSESSSEGLFFNEKNKDVLNNFLLERINFKSNRKKSRKFVENSVSLHSSYVRAIKHHHINNCITNSNPFDCVNFGNFKIIKFTKNKKEFSKVSFFTKNHISFFERRLLKKPEPRLRDYSIYKCIEKVYKKIVGVNKEKEVIDTKHIRLSQKKGGF